MPQLQPQEAEHELGRNRARALNCTLGNSWVDREGANETLAINATLGRFVELYTDTVGAEKGVFKTIVSASDERLKMIERDLGEGYLEKLREVNVILFSWLEGGGKDVGITAQQLQEVFDGPDDELKGRLTTEADGVTYVNFNGLTAVRWRLINTSYQNLRITISTTPLL